MGKMKKRYRVRRILALILAAAMSITMVPQTALAAPTDETAAVSEGTDGIDTAEENSEPDADGGEADAGDGTENVADDGSGKNTEIDGEESDDSDTAAKNAEDAVTENAANDNDASSADQTDSNEEEVEASAEGDTAPTAAPIYKILTDSVETTAEYTGWEVFSGVLYQVELQTTENGETWTEDGYSAGVTCVWKQKGADGSFAPMAEGASPVNAGSYQAVFSYKQDTASAEDVTVDFEITKAPVTIRLTGSSLTVTPGTLREKVTVPEIDRVECAGNGIDPQDLVLTVNGIRDAVTDAAVENGTALLKNGDYVMDITPDFSANASEEKKNNYKLEAFTADITMAELIATKVVVKVADKWKTEDGDFIIKKDYDGKPMEASKNDGDAPDYTYEVQMEDASAPDGWKKIEGAEVVDKWEEYYGCERDQDGNVLSPVNAGSYYYGVAYAGEDGVYAESYPEWINVEIAAAKLTVEAAEKSPLTVLEGTTMREVVSGIDYKVTDGAGKDVTKTMQENHIWGTGFDDTNVSQIYEPLFTLQEQKDGKWQDIDDADYSLVGGGKYRVVYKGQKAVFNADGTYSHRTGVNDGRNINGVDGNYETATEATADDKALAVEVTSGTEAEIDVSKLLDKGKETLAELTKATKEYDGKPLYETRSQYKNSISLKAKDGGASIKTELREFTFTWEKYGDNEDLLDAQIDDENQKNGLQSGGPADDDYWHDISGRTNPSPSDAGVYRLTIRYEDKLDDGKLNFVKEPKVVYFAIDPKQVQIVPEVPEDGYNALAGHTIQSFFDRQELKGSIQTLDGKPVSDETIKAGWQIVETVQQTPPAEPVVRTYTQYDGEWGYFNGDAAARYELQGGAVLDSWAGEWEPTLNYTCNSSEKSYVEGTEPKQAMRVEKPLSDAIPITVKPMGTAELVIAVDASKWTVEPKVYDAKPYEVKDLITDGLVTVKKKADGTPVDNAELVFFAYDEEGGAYSLENCADAGNYDLYVRFDGSEAYSPVGYVEGSDEKVNLWEGVKVGSFKITPREITLKANLSESYTAGTYVTDIVGEARGTFTVSGAVPEQEWAFSPKYDAYEGYYIPAWSYYDYSLETAGAPSFAIYEENSKEALDEWDQIRSGKSYEVKYDGTEQGLGYYYGVDEQAGQWVRINFARNYVVSGEKAAAFEAVRGNSTITSVSWPWGDSDDPVKKIAISTKNDEKDSMKREVTMLESIGYSFLTLDDGTEMEGNLAAFRITAPEEYNRMPDTAMYRNVIESAKVNGHVAEERYDSFTAVFDAAEGDKEFQIRWEDGYVETYKLKFSEATKLGNLREAVAPKSLAFNAPNKKMAVGESQQLDVKITKEQMGDVICLGYTSDNPQTLAVNENGSVTALKIGSATIKVFPQRYVKGKLEPIPNAKTATVKIQATKLTAPKKVTSTVRGTYVNLNYDTPVDGYRREIYVAKKDNSLKTAAQFESILKGMKEGQWKERFVIAPVYLDEADENLNRRKGYTVQLSGLDVNTDYTVYVRNACAARTLADGSVITKAAVDESAAGAVVNVKTRKTELVGLDFYVFASGGWDYDEDGNHRILWLSKVQNKTVQCTPYGYFPAVGADQAADEDDRVRIALPFKGEDKKKYKDIYEEPKLEYALKFASEGSDKYAMKNKAASIDKKGKIKFTGIPSEDDPLVVRMRDTVTGVTEYTVFSFRDQADSVAAVKKSVTLSVGQTQNLGELLSYKLGNTKLTYYGSQWLDMDAVRSAIKTQKQEQYFSVNSWGGLIAIKQGGSLTLQLTDKNVERLSGKEKATAAVTIKSADLTAIKKLKGYDVIHDRFGLQFTYAGYTNKFLLEISDAKKPIYSKVVSRGYEVDQAYQRDKNGYLVYDKNGDTIPLKDTYEISPSSINRMVDLNKETQYTVKLTPIYGDIKAKTATAKVKTTKIPAMNTGLSSADDFGGMGIILSESDREFGDETLTVLSGNSYTLTAKPENNRGRVNDTLIWKVGNAKVASVKAAAGTYCITLKGMKPGRTTLEVSSKILGNKVIARYKIVVVAVGDAYKEDGSIRYFGDNEPGYPESPSTPGQIGDGEPTYLPLSVDDPRKVAVNQTEQFSFTAPETGRYRIQAIKSSGLSVTLQMRSPSYKSGTDSLDLGWIQAGKGNSVNLTSYAKYNRNADTSYYVEVTLEQAVEAVSVGETQIEVKGSSVQERLRFTPSEDGDYQFSLVDQYGGTVYLYLYEQEGDAVSQYGSADESGTSFTYTLTKGKSVWLKTSYLYSYSGPYTLKIEKVSAQPTP